MQKISLVIPCYNEAPVLPNLFDRITQNIDSWLDYECEVICVDDGSKDKTLQLLKEQSQKDNRWKVIALSRNFGHQPAVTCGLSYTSGDAVVVMDADLQDPPEILPEFIQKWKEGYDVVYAVRAKRHEGTVKNSLYWLFYRFLAYLSDYEIPLDSGDFALMDKRVVEVLNKMPERNRFVRGLRAWTGFKQIGIKYDRPAREAGETNYTFSKLFKLATDGLISFSSKPLTLSFYFGSAVAVFSLLGIIFTLLQRIFHSTFEAWGIGAPPGFATIVISVLFLGGVQLMFMGILGSYLGRIYDEVKQRPQWIIDEKHGF